MAKRAKGPSKKEIEDIEMDPEESEASDDADDLDPASADDDIVDYSDDYDELDEGGPSSRGRRTSYDNLKAIDQEFALLANPKRAQPQRKGAKPVEGIDPKDNLNDPEVALKVWNKLQKTHGKEKAKAYNVQNDYTLDDIVDHPGFGRGYVIEILSNSKFVVLFESGLRRLVYNLQN